MTPTASQPAAPEGWDDLEPLLVNVRELELHVEARIGGARSDKVVTLNRFHAAGPVQVLALRYLPGVGALVLYVHREAPGEVQVTYVPESNLAGVTPSEAGDLFVALARQAAKPAETESRTKAPRRKAETTGA